MTLTDFLDDILHQIYSFIPTIKSLRNFTQVNKRACQWMLGGKTTDPLFVGMLVNEHLAKPVILVDANHGKNCTRHDNVNLKQQQME